ncbi:cyclic AMP-dependent transcription factor ATF-3 [Exaiptasia diaphana]|uniref:BZIP domain-containing protein n=1 Tax=Exaiptasia diaphana TaxID=2652724 RepID=A0A913X068_EXADI|nr:cyclic AMP-dependent transcription factor ATF-3 [Exaiptasia diaphana]KXJ29925.1 Cyclic AMP-dependent transcription factor ATF-2 [Exaiptasia diaphana]
MDYGFVPQGGSAIYMDPSVIRNAANPTPDGFPLDTNFEIADLPVKLELRYAIESKRAANGLECPKTEYKPMNKKNDLTEDEMNRRKVRRMRNKIAASKCRMKRKQHVNELMTASEELESANSQLESDIACLHAEISQLEQMLQGHKCIAHGKLGEDRGQA